MPLFRHARRALLLTALTGALLACQRPPEPAHESAPHGPAEAVLQLADDLHGNDLAGYARHALPPALHARMQTAWREGRTIWPLTELPLDDRLPGLIAALSAAQAEKTLLATYQRQFAGQHRELRNAAATLGLFASQFVQNEGGFSDAERAHYVQLLAALSHWGQRAPLGDPAHARTAIPQLVAAARLTGLTPRAGQQRADPVDAFQQAGMVRSLERLGPFLARFKQVLRGYGLDLDATLAGVEASVVEQSGEEARVRLRYTLGGEPIEAEVRLRRLDGRWYLNDLLRHAEAAAATPAPAPAALAAS